MCDPCFEDHRRDVPPARPEEEPHCSRRSVLAQSAVAVIALGAGIGPAAAGRTAKPPGRTKVIDCHAHLHHRSRPTWEADDGKLIAAADRLGIELLCCSMLTPRRPAT